MPAARSFSPRPGVRKTRAAVRTGTRPNRRRVERLGPLAREGSLARSRDSRPGHKGRLGTGARRAGRRGKGPDPEVCLQSEAIRKIDARDARLLQRQHSLAEPLLRPSSCAPRKLCCRMCAGDSSGFARSAVLSSRLTTAGGNPASARRSATCSIAGALNDQPRTACRVVPSARARESAHRSSVRLPALNTAKSAVRIRAGPTSPRGGATGAVLPFGGRPATSTPCSCSAIGSAAPAGNRSSCAERRTRGGKVALHGVTGSGGREPARRP